jgi:hypothetical protein
VGVEQRLHVAEEVGRAISRGRVIGRREQDDQEATAGEKGPADGCQATRPERIGPRRVHGRTSVDVARRI